MRVIATKTLKAYIQKFHKSEQALKSWLQEVEAAEWNSPQKLKVQFKNASVISNKRIVFNINANKYRLIVDIEYKLKIVFIVWFGTHKEYDFIDVKKIRYDKANKK